MDGELRAPNGRMTRDLGFTVIELEHPYFALPLGTGRNCSIPIAIAEAAQLVGGFSAPDLLLKASKNFQNFMNGDVFHGAYGRRIGHQAMNVVTKLKTDDHSRRGVITLWDPLLDNQPGKFDYPCTVAIQFEVEAGKLCMNVIMRSNDAWLGLPYDMFQFAQLHLSVCNALQYDAGWYRHTALSLHLYADDMEKALTIHEPMDFQFQPQGFGREGDSFTTIMKRARNCTLIHSGDNSDDTPSEAWYRDQFKTYLGRDVDGDRATDGAAEPVLQG